MNRLAVYAGDGLPIFRRDSQFLVSTFFGVIKFEYIFFFIMADIEVTYKTQKSLILF